MITKREAAIISAYTGYLLGDFEDVNKYAIELFGEERWDKEFSDDKIMDELHEKAKKDFESIKIKQPKKAIKRQFYRGYPQEKKCQNRK